MKKCNRCLIEKPKADFFKDASNKDGLNRECRACASRRMKQSDAVNELIQNFCFGRLNENYSTNNVER